MYIILERKDSQDIRISIFSITVHIKINILLILSIFYVLSTILFYLLYKIMLR